MAWSPVRWLTLIPSSGEPLSRVSVLGPHGASLRSHPNTPGPSSSSSCCFRGNLSKVRSPVSFIPNTTRASHNTRCRLGPRNPLERREGRQAAEGTFCQVRWVGCEDAVARRHPPCHSGRGAGAARLHLLTDTQAGVEARTSYRTSGRSPTLQGFYHYE